MPIDPKHTAALIINLTDGGITLPTFFLSEKDEKESANPQKIVLGASCDRGIDGMKQPEYAINRYGLEYLKKDKIFLAFVSNRFVDVRAPSVELM